MEDGAGSGAEHQTVAAGAATWGQGDSRPTVPPRPIFAVAPAPSPTPAPAAHYLPRPNIYHLLALKVWLDVDELDDLAKLEEYVHGSVLMLAFMSKGYFLSANCQRELKAAIDADP
jgi:hypothetical protein